MIAVMNDCLSHIFNWCEENNYPKLTSLAVRTTERYPGSGFWDLIFAQQPTELRKRTLTEIYQQEVFESFTALSRISGRSLVHYVINVEHEFMDDADVVPPAPYVQTTVTLPGCKVTRSFLLKQNSRAVAMDKAFHAILNHVSYCLREGKQGGEGENLSELRHLVYTNENA